MPRAATRGISVFNKTVSNVTIHQHCNKGRLILPLVLTRPALVLLISAMLLAFVLIQGCGGASAVAASAVSQPSPSISIAPSSASVQMWQNLQFTVSEDTSGAQRTWQTSQPSILTSLGSGEFQGVQQGTTQVSVACGALSATASVVVTAQQVSGPIEITSAGIYSGNWTSTDPNTPAVTIHTDQPVIIQDSVITSRGALIHISGVKTGADVTVENVTEQRLIPKSQAGSAEPLYPLPMLLL